MMVTQKHGAADSGRIRSAAEAERVWTDLARQREHDLGVERRAGRGSGQYARFLESILNETKNAARAARAKFVPLAVKLTPAIGDSLVNRALERTHRSPAPVKLTPALSARLLSRVAA